VWENSQSLRTPHPPFLFAILRIFDKINPTMKKFKKPIAIGIAVLILGGIGYLIIKPKVTPLKVETAKVEQGSIKEIIIASGEVEASQSASLNFASYGTLNWLGVAEGDKVKQWQALASIDKTSLKETHNTQFIAYQTAITNLDKYIQAEAEVLATYRDTQATGVTDAKKAQAKQAVDAARYAVESSLASLKIAEQSLKKTTIITPIAGTVTVVNVKLGEEVSATTGTAVEIADLSGFKFAVEIDESEIGKIKLGQPATIELNAYEGETFEARVVKIAPAATKDSSGNKIFKIELNFTKSDKLLVGLEGDTEIALLEKVNIVVIPWEALVLEGDDEFVFKVEDGLAVKTKVTTGSQSEDEYEVGTGLSVGDTIILDPDEKLTDGKKISAK
jgi:RND family efflux transporter MFP subunit